MAGSHRRTSLVLCATTRAAAGRGGDSADCSNCSREATVIDVGDHGREQGDVAAVYAMGYTARCEHRPGPEGDYQRLVRALAVRAGF
jgi:hypothetical protein